MQFIKSIISSSQGSVPYFSYPAWFVDDVFTEFGLTVVVHDTITGRDTALDTPFMLGSEIFGFGVDPHGAREYLVCYDSKTVKLHSYITEVECGISEGERIGYVSEDKLLLKNDKVFHKNLGRENRSLVISTVDEVVQLFGVGGSIAVRDFSDDRDSEVITPYELFRNISRISGINLFAYERIQFYSVKYRKWCKLRLDQSVEARRYFTKVWLDMTRG